MHSELDRIVEELRAHEPPPPDPSLRRAILAAFNGAAFESTASTRRATALATSRVRVVRRLAAAALLGSIVGVFGIHSAVAPRIDLAPRAPDADAVFQRALLEARVAAARETLESRELWAPASAVTSASSVSPASPAARAGFVIARDPAEPVREVAALIDQPVGSLLRLASARMLESVDRDLAATRYRELLQDFPLGAASAVARSRLRSLPP